MHRGAASFVLHRLRALQGRWVQRAAAAFSLVAATLAAPDHLIAISACREAYATDDG